MWNKVHYPVLSETATVENLFALFFSPSAPVVFDPVGTLQTFMETQVLPNAKRRYGSDYGINAQLEEDMAARNIVFLNDANDFSRPNYGKTQDSSMMNRMCSTLYNGIDFSKRISEDEAAKMSKGGAITQIKENKKIPLDHLHFSFYQLNLFTPHYSFPINKEFLARSTVVSNTQVCLDNAWREVTILLLKHFLPDQHKQILQVQKQVVGYRERITDLQRQFENYMINTDQDTLHDIEKYSALKNSIEDIRVAKD